MRSLRQQSSFRSSFLPGLLALLCACSFKAPSLLEGDASPDGGLGADAPLGEEPLELIMSATSMDVAEEATATVDVRLRFRPATDVTLSMTSSDPAAVSVTSSLTFTQANYATAQTLVINGIQDADVANETITVTISVPGIPNSSLTVNVIDNDTVGIVLSRTTISLGEATSTTFTVRLSAQPESNTNVSISSSDTGAASVTPSSPLAFTSSNWSNPQSVIVAGVADIDLANESVAITVSSTGMASRTVNASVVDDDTQAVQMSPNIMTINEGSAGAVSVSLRFQPANNVTVSLASSNSAVAGVSNSPLTFTPTNFSTAQAVTITGVQDANAAQDSATITALSSGATSASTGITVNDDDTMAILTSVSSLAVNEGGAGSFTVRLSAQPPGDLLVSISSSDPAAASPSPATLTFTQSNWSSDQTVTVNGVHDSDSMDASLPLSLTSGALSQSVNVYVLDDDPGCGDGFCNNMDETYYTCPQDCPFDSCGDGLCLPEEGGPGCSCPQDCNCFPMD